MQTGEVLQLRDVIGDDWTPLSLLDTGAFQCLWVWKDGNENDEESSEWWLQSVREQWENNDRYGSLDALDSDFYLTQDGLGLITFVSRYYNPIEAKFEDLGVEFGSRE